MWEVLLSQGEPFGTRSPELHEPLRTGLHMLRVPGDISPEDGAAGAHGVTHWGNALQVFLLLPAVHAEEGLAEPHDQAAWSP